MSGDDLRALAEAATPGPWECHGDPLVWPSDRGPAANDPIAWVGEAHEECAAFIAAANPTAVLALLDRAEAAEAAVARVRALADEWVKRDCEWSCESEMLDDLRAALDGPQ